MTDVAKANSIRSALTALHNDSFDRDGLQEWHKAIDLDTKAILKTALIVAMLIFGVGGIWSVTAPLGGAVIAPGRVVAEGRNRVIQHKEGGILKEVFVREGQLVQSGDLLVKLDDTQIRSQLEAAWIERAINRIELARRRAEVAEATDVAFPKDIHPAVANDQRVMEAIASQRSEFDAVRRYYAAKIEILRSKIKGERTDIVGNNQVLEAYDLQQELYRKELSDYRDLHAKGLMQRTRVFTTERKVAELDARIKNVALANDKSLNNIENFENEIKQTRLAYLKEANAGVVGLQKALNELAGRITTLEDMQKRSEIRSPVTGYVFRIGKLTLGGVIAPGESVVEIFPQNDTLNVEAMVQVKDIELVHVDQEVNVVFSSTQQLGLKPIDGKIIYLSADSVVSETNPEGYYVARVELHPDAENVRQLLPGNVAQVYIKTEPKTFFEHITGPIMRYAFNVFKG